ncbi:MAG: lipopolysaccharide biosynthesis protein [Hyphomicrobiales bacterium]|nr:lipopolysaccharide biosynthesis protein [Hyphomicrobiales bacterium]
MALDPGSPVAFAADDLRPSALVQRLRAVVAGLGERSIAARTRRAALFSVAARVFNAGALLLTHILLARALGATEFGLFSLAMTWVLALVGFAALGLTMAPQRFVPDYAAQGRFRLLAGLYRFAHLAPLAAGLLMALAAAAVLAVAMPSISGHTRLAIALALLALPALAMIDVIEGFALAHDWNDLAYGVTFIVRPLLLPLLCLALWLGGADPAATPAIAAFVASAWIAALALALLLRPRMRAAYPASQPAYEPRRWFSLALPALLADGAFLTMAYADVLILSAFASPAEVGVYVAATKVVGIVAFVHFGLSYAAAHHFSALHGQGDADALVQYARKAARWTFWPSLLLALGLGLAAPLLMGLFGRDFSGGAVLVGILALALVARAVIGPSEQLLLMTDRAADVTRVYAAAAGLNIVLALGLAPVIGAIGVAIGAAVASIAVTLATWLVVRHRLGRSVHAFAGEPPAVVRKTVA